MKVFRKYHQKLILQMAPRLQDMQHSFTVIAICFES